MIFFSGTHSGERIASLCAAYSASLYPFPAINSVDGMATPTAISTAVSPQLLRIRDRLATIGDVSKASTAAQSELLRSVAVEWEDWAQMVARCKAVYATMNLLSSDQASAILIGEGWVPCDRAADLDHILAGASLNDRHPHSHPHTSASSSSSSSSSSTLSPSVPGGRSGLSPQGGAVPCVAHLVIPPSGVTPPTLLRSNKFTSAAQAVVDSYGVARYGEINPALATLVTFPYLFGIMFGDFGHGILFALFSLLLILFEDKLATWRNDV